MIQIGRILQVWVLHMPFFGVKIHCFLIIKLLFDRMFDDLHLFFLLQINIFRGKAGLDHLQCACQFFLQTQSLQ